MKKFIVILTFFNALAAFGQKMPSDYFKEAELSFETGTWSDALSGYQYIVDHYPKNELYPRAFYNVGYLHFLLKNTDKAIIVFKQIIESDFNEKENLGGNIMSDPYTNYRHRASEILSEIYYGRKNYDKALYYFALSDTTYPYLHFCGNEIASNNFNTAMRYADIYQKLKQPDKAIQKLLPLAFIAQDEDSKALDELKKLLTGKKGLKQKLDQALNNTYSKTISGNNPYTAYYFKFLGAEIYVPESYETEERKFDKNKAIAEIRESDFYKMIEQL